MVFNPVMMNALLDKLKRHPDAILTCVVPDIPFFDWYKLLNSNNSTFGTEWIPIGAEHIHSRITSAPIGKFPFPTYLVAIKYMVPPDSEGGVM